MPKPKQPRDEEDEKVCLLSAQQDSPGPHLPSLSNNSSNMSTPTFNGHHHCHPPGGGSSSKETEGGREHEVGAVGGGEKGGGGADAEQEQQGGNKDAREDYLITGEAEKAFFNVCTKRGSSSSSSQKQQQQHPSEPAVTMASIAAVRDILSDIESKGGNNNKLANSEEKENKSGNSNSSCNCEGPPAVGGQRGPQTGFYHRGDISGTSSSLVVDVHLPPEERQQQQQHQQQQKLCKHSVSRFQRCYSDGSQAQSPSAKRKAISSYNQSGSTPAFKSSTSSANKNRYSGGSLSGTSSSGHYGCGTQYNQHNSSSAATAATTLKVEEECDRAAKVAEADIQNPDKIETVCETPSRPVDLTTAPSSNNPTSLKDRIRHFSESHSAKKKRIQCSSTGANPVKKMENDGDGKSFSGPRSTTTSLFTHLISHKKKHPSSDAVIDSPSSSSSSAVAGLHHPLPTSMANPNVKFDIFHSSSSDNNNPNHYLHHGEASGRRDDTEDDDDEEDEEDELATTDLLKKTKHRDYLAKKLNLASGSFNDSTSSLASSSAGIPRSSHPHVYPSHHLPSSSVNGAGASASSTSSILRNGGLGGSSGVHSASGYFTQQDSPYRDWSTVSIQQQQQLQQLQHLHQDSASCLSQSSSTVSLPACRICQLPAMEHKNNLISPCRCLGSIRYVHNNCLLKWLEVSSRRRDGPACCELCQYQYLRHKKFVISLWRFPECSLKDKVLHLFFIFCVCIMVACAAVTIICFKDERWPFRHSHTNKYKPSELTPPELISLWCAILFFSAFFLAMYVELKAKHTVYQLVCKFFYMNHEWSVEEYDRKRDVSRKNLDLESPDGHG